jgi:hypothetical protein
MPQELEHALMLPEITKPGVAEDLKQKGFEFLKKYWPKLTEEACTWWAQNKDKNASDLFHLPGLSSALSNALPIPYKFIPGVLVAIAGVLIKVGLNTLCDQRPSSPPQPS